VHGPAEGKFVAVGGCVSRFHEIVVGLCERRRAAVI
jgi:hypothetical protein